MRARRASTTSTSATASFEAARSFPGHGICCSAMNERRVIGSSPREKEVPSFSYPSDSIGSGSVPAGATRSRAAATSERAAARAGLFSSASATRASTGAAESVPAGGEAPAAPAGSARRTVERTADIAATSRGGRFRNMRHLGETVIEPSRLGRARARFPGSQFRNVSRRAWVGAERARVGGAESRNAIAGVAGRSSSPASAVRTGGAKAAVGATSAAGTGVGCEMEHPQPSAGAGTAGSEASPAQQQSARIGPQAIALPGRNSCTPRNVRTATRRATARVAVRRRGRVIPDKVEEKSDLSSPIFRNVLLFAGTRTPSGTRLTKRTRVPSIT